MHPSLARTAAVILALGILHAADDAPGAQPPRLTRAESFLGMHFDFHARQDCTEIGRRTTRELVAAIIDQVHPDYLQIDGKGHPGLSSYPTKVGNPAPGFVGDPLRIWRQETAAHGVALYLHYSGVWDAEAIHRHPQWAAIRADGKPEAHAVSLFGGYAEGLLIPQLRELASDYGLDGAWIDGECWGAVPDYSEPALRAFRAATGIEQVPRGPGDAHWREFLAFGREAYRAYLRRYLAEVKRAAPGFQLCSNWAFTDHMPEPVSAPVDWLSGDYSAEDSVDSARFSARYLAQQGRPWDLMAWSFAGKRQKSAVQLQREAATVLALGGGFQAYFRQRRDGSVDLDQMPVMAEVAAFCRARQPFCHHAQPVPQVALVYATAAHYRASDGLFPRDLSRIRGTLQALLEGQQAVDVVSEHHLAGRMAAYPLIILAECDFLETAFRQELVEYVRAGGQLLLVGPRTAAMFQGELDVAMPGAAQVQPRFLVHDGALEPTTGEVQGVVLGTAAQPFGLLRERADGDAPAQPAASIAILGRGRIAATYCDLSQGYLRTRSATTRDFLNALVRRLFPEPLVEVRGSPDVDVVVARLRGRLTVSLVNTAGPHASVAILEAIPAIGPLTVSIRLPASPARIVVEPAGREVPFAYRDGAAHLTLPQLAIHDIVVVQ